MLPLLWDVPAVPPRDSGPAPTFDAFVPEPPMPAMPLFTFEFALLAFGSSPLLAVPDEDPPRRALSFEPALALVARRLVSLAPPEF